MYKLKHNLALRMKKKMFWCLNSEYNSERVMVWILHDSTQEYIQCYPVGKSKWNPRSGFRRLFGEIFRLFLSDKLRYSRDSRRH